MHIQRYFLPDLVWDKGHICALLVSSGSGDLTNPHHTSPPLLSTWMIAAEEFREQCQQELLPLINRWHMCQQACWSQTLHCLDLVLFLCKGRRRAPPFAKLDVRISYNQVYRTPQLQFRFWELDTSTAEFESWRLRFKDLSEIPLFNRASFSITLGQTIHGNRTEAWYLVNACDTEDNVGPEPVHYMHRWFSRYGTLFDDQLGVLFVASL
ncbi:E2-like conjugating enzyme Ecym_8412 [Eremothecium cymbalariae DBVPG|uniref:Uncharacterized protein n=1 Tax=Eremothecium cymbalariae (strain CBS 270.75 / DBVPG 7215 / KCTC 17166 / NRRL Y-17582) TaxID=931890 RepID=G8JXV7_ERECY|nr:Hypothetical protein Ecym_8412 [Eremothecium cymbalariae DBVPG\